MNRSSPLATLAVLFLAASAQAQAPDAVLSMCRRDVKNAVRRLNANDASAVSTLQGVVQRCQGEELKSLAAYPDFLKEFEEARKLLESKVQAAQTAQTEQKQAAFDSEPGGANIRDRWKTMPERCAPPSWETIDGKTRRVKAAPPPASSRMSGLEAAAPTGQMDPRILEDSPHRPEVLSGDDWVTRLACGHDAEGIDPYFTERDLLGAIDRKGSIVSLAESLAQDQGTPRHTLRHAMLVHQCFAASGFNAKQDYERYLWCVDAVGTAPSAEVVAQAADATFPEDGWERRNLRFLYTRGLAAKQEVVTGFTQAEATWPAMKAVYRDTQTQARADHAQRRTRYAELFKVLDPLTAAVADGKLPDSCLETLRPMRAQLSKELPPRSEAGVYQLRAGHPVGFQISEALAACYLTKGQKAHARLELRGLRQAQRRITLEEELYYAVEDAVAAARKKYPGPEGEKQIPNLSRGPHYGVPYPATLAIQGRLWEQVGDARALGDSKEIPADITRVEPGPGGVKVSFKPVKYPYQKTECRNTDRISQVIYHTFSAQVIYEQECVAVGPVEMRTHQEPPVVVPTEEAALIKPGMRVTLIVSADGKDVAVEKLGWPDKPALVVVHGIPLEAK
jgi:hypothetical protein